MTDFSIAKYGYVRYYNLLEKYLSFKSVSTSSSYKKQINDTAQWLNTLFTNHNFSSQILTGYGNPIVVATYQINTSLPTCLIYGHYDVQPADITDGWTSDPFTLRSDGKKLYGRGVVDNKGQTLIHMMTIFQLIKERKLGMNVIFLIEGDEETGGADLPRFISDHRQHVKADFSLISDGEMHGSTPTIEAGLRGGFNITLSIKTSDADLHSGIYGGKSPNAAHELTRILSKMHNADYQVTIPGFQDDVDELPKDLAVSTHTLLPAVEVTTLQSGYMNDGYRNSIPATATAKINIRLVKSQTPETLFNFFEQFVKKNISTHTSYTLTYDHPHNAVKLDLNNHFVQRATKILATVYKKQPIFTYSGGAIPIVDYLTDSLKLPTLLVNLANDDCNMHAGNENFDIDLIKKGLEFSRQFFS